MESDTFVDSRITSGVAESGVFRISPLRFAVLMTGIFGSGWLYAMGLAALVALVASFAFDYRIFIVAMMFLLLLVPMMLMMLYYRYGLKGECYVNVVPHRIRAEEGRVRVFVAPFPPAADEENENENAPESDRCVDAEWKVVDYDPRWLGPYTVGSDYVVFPFLPPREGFLYIPSEAFENDEEFASMVKRIARAAGDNSKKSE